MTLSAKVYPMHAAPRCGAKTRRGTPCKAPAIRGRKRCRMHGGLSPGAPRGNRHNWRHGRYSREAMERRREVAELIREMRSLMCQLGVCRGYGGCTSHNAGADISSPD